MMHWYKVVTRDEDHEGHSYVGSSDLSPGELALAIDDGRMVRLDNLLYMDRGDIKEWEEWDKSVHPTMYIHPRTIWSFMEFKGDPRETPRK